MRVDVRMTVAVLLEPRRHGLQREVGGIALLYLDPSQRRRHARVGTRAYRERRRNRPIFGVLVVVDEDAVPFLLPPLAGGDRRRAPLDLTRKGDGSPAHLDKGPLTLDADVDMNAARAGGLRPADQIEICQRGADDTRHVLDLAPFHTWHRIEIDAQLVRMIEILGEHRMRMQLDAGEIR